MLLTPTSSAVAPPLGTFKTDLPVASTRDYLLENLRLVPFTVHYNIGGQPAMSVPISAELSILSKRARSTFKIFPRNGKMA